MSYVDLSHFHNLSLAQINSQDNYSQELKEIIDTFSEEDRMKWEIYKTYDDKGTPISGIHQAVYRIGYTITGQDKLIPLSSPEASGARVVLLYNKKENLFLLSIEGTDFGNLNDILTDYDLLRIATKGERKIVKQEKEILHILREIKEIIDANDGTLVISGHSLGGGLSQILSARCMKSQYKEYICPQKILYTVTFDSPSVVQYIENLGLSDIQNKLGVTNYMYRANIVNVFSDLSPVTNYMISGTHSDKGKLKIAAGGLILRNLDYLFTGNTKHTHGLDTITNTLASNHTKLEIDTFVTINAWGILDAPFPIATYIYGVCQQQYLCRNVANIPINLLVDGVWAGYNGLPDGIHGFLANVATNLEAIANVLSGYVLRPSYNFFYDYFLAPIAIVTNYVLAPIAGIPGYLYACLPNFIAMRFNDAGNLGNVFKFAAKSSIPIVLSWSIARLMKIYQQSNKLHSINEQTSACMEDLGGVSCTIEGGVHDISFKKIDENKLRVSDIMPDLRLLVKEICTDNRHRDIVVKSAIAPDKLGLDILHQAMQKQNNNLSCKYHADSDGDYISFILNTIEELEDGYVNSFINQLVRFYILLPEYRDRITKYGVSLIQAEYNDSARDDVRDMIQSMRREGGSYAQILEQFIGDKDQLMIDGFFDILLKNMLEDLLQKLNNHAYSEDDDFLYITISGGYTSYLRKYLYNDEGLKAEYKQILPILFKFEAEIACNSHYESKLMPSNSLCPEKEPITATDTICLKVQFIKYLLQSINSNNVGNVKNILTLGIDVMGRDYVNDLLEDGEILAQAKKLRNADPEIEYEIFKHQYGLEDSKVTAKQYKVLQKVFGNEDIAVAIIMKYLYKKSALLATYGDVNDILTRFFKINSTESIKHKIYKLITKIISSEFFSDTGSNNKKDSEAELFQILEMISLYGFKNYNEYKEQIIRSIESNLDLDINKQPEKIYRMR